MDDKDVAKKPPGNPPTSHETDAELNENELEQVSGGVALAEPVNPHRKKPFKYY